MIAKGFGINAINPGVLLFWIAACTYANKELHIQGTGLLYYFGVTILTLFCVDLLKIYYSSKLKKYLKPHNSCYIGMAVGAALFFLELQYILKRLTL